MSLSSNEAGRAFELACLTALYRALQPTTEVSIVDNYSFRAARRSWNDTPADFRKNVRLAAVAATEKLLELEPTLTAGSTTLTSGSRPRLYLRIPLDEEGEAGDVRDIVVTCPDNGWEIGLSVKHNHFAVKHSRLSPTIDFGAKWYKLPCSDSYWQSVRPIFDRLVREQSRHLRWSDLADKEDGVYIPLLNAFMDELHSAARRDPDFPRRMVEYLLGEHDFYKIIARDDIRATEIQPFNLRGRLDRRIAVMSLPTKIENMRIRSWGKNTVELYFDSGWSFSFRIHNASSYVEPSLKFDIQLTAQNTGKPIICRWEKAQS